MTRFGLTHAHVSSRALFLGLALLMAGGTFVPTHARAQSTYQEGDGKGSVSQTDDATILVTTPTTNYGTSAAINWDNPDHEHTVIKFPNIFGGGGDQIPLGSTITSATLTFEIFEPGSTASVYQLTEDWVESQVTWNERSSGVNWTNAGADGTGSHVASADGSLSGSSGSRTVTVTTSVQAWSGGSGNYGWVIVEGGTDGVDARSSEYTTQGQRPLLTVNWTVPDVTAPAAVSNLATGTVGSTTVALSWTAPGDDGSTGTATTYDVRYSTSTITEGNWASASQATGEPSPQVAGSSESFTVTGLTGSTTYFFAIKTSDEVPNTSAISNVPSTTTAPPDVTAPAAVSDLATGAATASTVQLSWTAPGDDGATGTATTYDVRYSTSTITEGDWASATQASGEPSPQVAGSGESFTVTGLSATTTYFFAIKTSDEVPNTSAISNVPSGATNNCTTGWVCWDGGGSTNNWSEGANWTTNSVPASTAFVLFNSTGTKNATVNIASTVANLTIDSGYTGTLTLAAGLTNNGDFIQNGGTLDLNGQTLTQRGDWDYTAGTTPTDGTVVFDDSNTSTLTVTGSHSLANVTVNATNNTFNLVIASGTTLTVNGTYTHTGDERIDIEDGDIHLKGDITLSNTNNSGRGDGTLTINGTGTQNLTGASAIRQSALGNVVIDKATGTLNLSNWVNITSSWTYTQGALVPGTSTVAFVRDTDITGTHTLGNVTFSSQGDRTQTIAGGTILTATGTVTIDGGGGDDLDLDGGDVHAQGDVVITNTGNGGGGSATITMNGAGAQALIGPAASDEGPLPNLTVDKSTGTVTLTGSPTVTGTFTLTQGELAHGTGAANGLTLEGTTTVAAAGIWTNYSEFTSTLTFGGSVSNAGSIDFDATAGTCGDADVILLRSDASPTQRLWSGAGSFSMTDVNVQDQAGSAAITVASGTDSGGNGANWTFSGCGPDVTAPDAVANLATGTVTSSSVQLTWTAPGDDGAAGTATTYDVRYSTATITELNWDAADEATGEPSPQVAGGGESFTVTGLSGSTTYYFAIKTSDEVPNESAISNVPSGTTDAPDLTAPDAVTNLATGTVTTSSIQLTWTAPGDDGATGTATTYDVRYSTSTITEGNWASATQATGEPSPQVASSSESFTVTGLSVATTYFFAIKTSDEEPNEAAISNVPSAATSNSGIHWGRDIQNPSNTTNAQSRAMGGTSPNTANMVIDTLAMYLGAQTGDVRMSVYTGGTEADPNGATLLWDAGTVNPGGVAGWYKIGHPTGIAWPANTVTWFAFKGDDGVAVYYQTDSGGAGDFQTARGRNANSFSTDGTVAFPAAYGETGTFSDFWYLVCIVHSVGGGGDSTPPDAVADLAAGNVTGTTADLTWTAPGDDGATGTATTYDVRYSTSTITEGNWASATQATGEPAPQVASSSESFTVTGLSPSTTYFFAIKTSDEVPNESPISNVPSLATAACAVGWVCWDGEGSTNDWSEDANWTGDVEPTSTDSVAFNAASTKDATLDVASTVAALTIDSGYGAGTFTLAAALTNDGNFIQNGGTLDLNSQTLTHKGAAWTYTAGTTPTDGTVVFDDSNSSTITVTGSQSLPNVTINANNGTLDFTIAGSDTLTVTGTYIHQGSSRIDIESGNVHAEGDVTLVNTSTGGSGSGTLTINGTGTQNLTGATANVRHGRVNNVVIDKASGTLNMFDNINVRATYTYVQGSIAPGTSTLVFTHNVTITGSHTLANVIFNSRGSDRTQTITAGDTLTLTGTVTIEGNNANSLTLDGGDVLVQGDIVIVNAGTNGGGSATITMNGTGAQALTGPTTAGEGKLPNLKVDKTSGSVTLTGNPTVAGTLTIEQGEFAHTTSAKNSLTIEGASSVSIAAAGTWTNESTDTSTVTLGGTVVNAGIIDFNATASTCGDADVILLRSSASPTQRLWSGAGTFGMVDVSVQDQAGSASITVQSSTDATGNGANWTFSGCGDVTPPDAVADLATGTVTGTSVELTWTAPGDDGATGTATTYDVRYSTSTINDGNWASATEATGEPAPQVASSAETFTVTGLSNGLTYYFAIKTSDEVPNESALSNVPSVATATLVVSVTPDTTTAGRLPSNGTNYTVDFDVVNGGTITEDFDLLTTQGPGTVITVVSITGTGVTQGGNPDSARVSSLAATDTAVVTVTYSVASVAAGTTDTLFFSARSVEEPTTIDDGRLEVTVERPNLTVVKAVTPNGTQLPGTDLTYTVTITNDGTYDATSVVVLDSIPAELDFKVGSVVNSLPVTATVEYSNDSGSSWTYVPVSAGCGAPTNYDRCVTHVRWTLDSDLSYIGPNNTGDVEFIARIQ